MTKQELKNGMIVETDNRTIYFYCDGMLTNSESSRHISDYNDNLTFRNGRFCHLDIVKVYPEPIWERSSTTELSIKEIEIEILKALDVLGFKYIAKNMAEEPFAYIAKPVKDKSSWLFNGNDLASDMVFLRLKKELFTFITWADKEPTSIQELLSGFEK